MRALSLLATLALLAGAGRTDTPGDAGHHASHLLTVPMNVAEVQRGDRPAEGGAEPAEQIGSGAAKTTGGHIRITERDHRDAPAHESPQQGHGRLG